MVWIIKYWETKGIYPLTVDRHPSPLIVVDRSISPFQYFNKGEWFETFFEAFNCAREKAKNRILSMENKIKNLRERYDLDEISK